MHIFKTKVNRKMIRVLIRLFFRSVGTNEQLVNRLAESAPIRQAARMVVYFFNRTKAITQDVDMKKLDETKLIETLKKIRDELEKKNKQM